MHRSDHRILTTHVGSLPRPPALRDLLIRHERGENIDTAEFQRQIEAAVHRVVAKQLEAGIDIGNNGEQPRVGFQTYVASRMQGFRNGGGQCRVGQAACAERGGRHGDAPAVGMRGGVGELAPSPLLLLLGQWHSCRHTGLSPMRGRGVAFAGCIFN